MSSFVPLTYASGFLFVDYALESSVHSQGTEVFCELIELIDRVRADYRVR
jgi:hypothetical protein